MADYAKRPEVTVQTMVSISNYSSDGFSEVRILLMRLRAMHRWK